MWLREVPMFLSSYITMTLERGDHRKIQDRTPERKILLERITFFIPVFLFWMTSLVISFIHESWGLVILWSNLLAPLNNFARISGDHWHYDSFYSTMTHLLHNDSSEYSIRIFWILLLYFGCVKLHNDSSCSTLTHSAPQWLIGIFF